MDEAIRLFIEQLNIQIDYVKETVNKIDTKLDVMCTNYNNLKSEFDEHKVHNGYSQGTIRDLKETVEPIKKIKNAIAIFVAIATFLGMIVYFQTQVRAIRDMIRPAVAGAINEDK